jgi:hypothetical protein
MPRSIEELLAELQPDDDAPELEAHDYHDRYDSRCKVCQYERLKALKNAREKLASEK